MYLEIVHHRVVRKRLHDSVDRPRDVAYAQCECLNGMTVLSTRLADLRLTVIQWLDLELVILNYIRSGLLRQ